MAITKIAQVDVGAGGAAFISFGSIPQTFTDLMLVASVRSAGTNSVLQVSLPGGQYAQNVIWLRGNGSAASSSSSIVSIAGLVDTTAETANTFSSVTTYIPNYANSQVKAYSMECVSENNGSTAYQQIASGKAYADPVTYLDMQIGGNTFAQYSSATLYGISKSGATGATVA
jgi:hypothetical protein